MNVVNRVAPKNKVSSAPLRKQKRVALPFSFNGIIAVLACPVLLFTDALTTGYTFLGVIFVVILALLGNERRTLVALFATVAVLTLAFDLRIIYGQPGAELAVMDKILALLFMPVIAYGFIHRSTALKKTKKRKPVVHMKVILPPAERIALNGEFHPDRNRRAKSVFRHISRSTGPLDEYTRELIWFVYMKSPKS